MGAQLQWLNTTPEDTVHEALLNCCGSRRWCQEMLLRRPFSDVKDLLNKAEEAGDTLTREDWKEAFAAHPKIGERETTGREQTQRWSKLEQAAAAAASTHAQLELERLNEEYYSRFGFIFIVCATGKSVDKILGILRERIHNDPAIELEIAAAEQRKITQIRLQKLIAT
jgi:OHCU decarboxylase